MEPAGKRIQDASAADPLYREDMIRQYLPHVKRIVHRIAARLPSHVETEDLINTGVIGLIQAIDRYDPGRDNKFLTYAVFRIKGAVLSELRSRDFLSRSNRKHIRELDAAYEKLEKKLGREPEDTEVAEEMGVGLKQLDQIKRVSSFSLVSLEEIGGAKDEDRDHRLSAWLRDDTEDALALAGLKEIKGALAQMIEELPYKEKLVISLYYLDELTMKETARVLDLTESRVSQIHAQAVLRLRSRLRKRGFIDK
jgi:RNA polymerase sigma factor FliA